MTEVLNIKDWVLNGETQFRWIIGIPNKERVYRLKNEIYLDLGSSVILKDTGGISGGIWKIIDFHNDCIHVTVKRIAAPCFEGRIEANDIIHVLAKVW